MTTYLDITMRLHCLHAANLALREEIRLMKLIRAALAARKQRSK